MGTLLCDVPIFNNDNTISVTKGRDPVADKECGSLIHNGFEFLHDRGFGLGVDGGENIIENKNFRATGDCACNGGALTLSAREGDAAFSEERLKSFWETFYFVGEVGGFSGPCEGVGFMLSKPKGEVVLKGFAKTG
mgnify:CR=1 FL=1